MFLIILSLSSSYGILYYFLLRSSFFFFFFLIHLFFSINRIKEFSIEIHKYLLSLSSTIFIQVEYRPFFHRSFQRLFLEFPSPRFRYRRERETFTFAIASHNIFFRCPFPCLILFLPRHSFLSISQSAFQFCSHRWKNIERICITVCPWSQ